MTTVFRGAVLALLVAAPRLGAAQQTPAPMPRPGQLVKEGVALHDKQDYPGAIAKYQAVTPGDSSYATAQSELALSLEAAGRHDDAVAAARRALVLNPFEPQTYNTLATAQDALKQVDAALATYATGRHLFPYNQNLVYNQGVVEFQHDQVAPALASLERSLELRPTHPNSHRLLGSLAAEQGQPAHALTSWLLCLLLGDDGAGAHDVLVLAERLSQGAPVVDDKDRVKPVAPNEAFEELDQLLESKAALQASYVSKVKFAAAVVKQTQLLVEKFPVDGPATDFWVRAYGPVMAALRQGDNLTAFTYLILQSADDKKASQWLKSNKSKVEAMLKAVLSPLVALRTSQQVADQPAGTRLPGWYTNGSLIGLGPGTTTASGEFQGSGAWVSIDAEAGYVDGRGQFNAAGKRVGEWKVFRPDGTLQTLAHYNDQGQREGLVREYHRNGQPATEASYRADKVEGLLTVFNECGARTGTRTFKDDNLEGPYTTYYDNGALRLRVNVHADKEDGVQEGFYADGTPEYRTTLALGQKQGPFVTYFPDKTVEREGSYDHNEYDGPYRENFFNGRPSTEGRYARGKHAGLWKTYFRNGKLSVEKSYDEAGELHGTYHDYDQTGHLFCDIEYVHGRTTHLRYYNRQGQPVLDKDTRKGRVAVELPDADGHKNATGTYLDGQMVGEWRWYHPGGGVRETSHFDEKGTKTGAAEFYFPGGQLQRRLHYDADGQEDGYFEQLTADGQPSNTGYYLAGQRHGPWKTYYSDGRVSEEIEYFKGQANGPARSYAPGGKLSQERRFEFDQLRRFVTFDSTGRVLTEVSFKPDTREYVLRYPGGQPYYRTGVGCFANHGPAVWYRPDGSVETTAAQLNGQREGPFRATFADGKPSQVGQYHAGEVAGEWLSYYPGGQLHQKNHYRDGDEDGEYQSYFPNGQLELQEGYEDGSRHGPSRRYNPAGELLLEKNFDNGTLLSYRGPGEGSAAQPVPNQTGSLAVSFANGKPAATETYAHNQLTGPATYYYSSGAVFRRTTFAQGLRTGLLESYYPNGKLMEQENYLHGELSGRCRYFRPDGTLEREQTYRCGERHGPGTTFDAAGKPLRNEVYWNGMAYGK